jgi:hypothetical protein
MFVEILDTGIIVLSLLIVAGIVIMAIKIYKKIKG